MSIGHPHKKTRKGQELNAIDYHHPEEKIKRIYRFVFLCKRAKATELCNVRNR